MRRKLVNTPAEVGMDWRWFILAGLLLFGGGLAWFVLSADAPPTVLPLAAVEPSDEPSDLPADQRAARAPLLPDDQGTEIVRPSESTETGHREPERPETRADRDAPASDRQSRDQQARDARRQAAAARRGPTAAEREERARVATGRPAHEARAALTPRARAGGAAGLARSLKPEEWAQSFRDEGLEPPPMIPTEIAGKVMSPLSREGLAEARVLLVSFLPWPGSEGGELYPVTSPLVANAKGEFKGEVPLPPRAPTGHASLGMIVQTGPEESPQQIAAGVAIEGVRAGEFNQLGIFWAPENLFEVDCDARDFSGALKVVCTGALSPLRWFAPRRDDALGLFAPVPVTPRIDGVPDDAAGRCKLVGTWNGRDLPYVSLVEGTAWRQTRRAVRAPATQQAPPPIPRPFETIRFVPDSGRAISGQVVDAQGAPVTGVMLVTVGDPTPVSTLSDGGGWFVIENPGELTRALRGSHDDFIATDFPNIAPGHNGLRLVMPHRKPVLWLMVRDRLTGAALQDISLAIHERVSGKAAPRVESHALQSQTGEYIHRAEWLVDKVILERVGYFPRTLSNPIVMQTQAGGRLDVYLNPGRTLDVRPRDFSAVQHTDRWFADSGTGPGVRSYWSNHWIEWQVDFGDAPEPGEEGGSFDILLGCTNDGLVDNEYRFIVEVYVDGAKKGNLHILADSVAPQTGRMKLGRLSGQHTVRLVWLNDKWIPEQLDANIRYASLQFIEQP